MTTQALTTGRQDQVISCIQWLADYYGHEFDPDDPRQMRVYVDALLDIPVEHLRAGCREVIRTETFMPRVATIRNAVDRALRAEERARSVIQDPDAGPPQREHYCRVCEDSGWRFVDPKPNAGPTVTRCVCFPSNPVLARQRGVATYGTEDQGR